MYFGVVTITTTGYGDLLPSNNTAKIFAAFWCFLGVVIISSVLGFIVAGILEQQSQKVVDNMKDKTIRVTAHPFLTKVCGKFPIPRPICIAFGWVFLLKFIVCLYQTHADPHPMHYSVFNLTDDTSIDFFLECNLETTSHLPLCTDKCATGCDCAYDTKFESSFDENTMGITFCGDDGLMYYYNDVVTVVYMVCVSMSSVGYGDFSPQGEQARMFAVFWILLGWLANGFAWGSLVTWMLSQWKDMLDRKTLHKVFDAKSIMKIDEDQGGSVTEVEFVVHMLLKVN
jgi:hypothetical protein